MASQISYRSIVNITSPDPSGDGGLMMQNNFRRLTDAILTVSGLGGGVTTQLNNLSGYLQRRDTDISGYFTSQLAGGSVTQGQLSTLSGYLDSRDSTLSGYLISLNSSIYGTIANDSNVSGYLQRRDTDISGYFASQLAGGGVTQGQLTTVSGYLDGRDSTLSGYLLSRDASISGYLTTFNQSTYGTITNDTNVSGYLNGRDISVSGYLSAVKESLTNKNAANGYLGLDSASRAILVGRAEPYSTIAYASTITTSASTGSFFKITLTGNLTLGNPTSAVDGQVIIWKLVQGSGGSKTLSLDTKFASGPFTVTLSISAGKVDFLAVKYDSGDDKFYVIGFSAGY